VDDNVSLTYTTVNVTVNMCANDLGGDPIDNVQIITDPLHGTVSPYNNCEVVYTFTGDASSICDPNAPIDSFRYVIANTGGRDTATVYIYRQGNPFHIYTGFSPNGDGVNETFWIDGLDQFPNNDIQVYNRWGNLVHEQKRYDNSWGGTWNGTDLPDGTYFYILNLNDEANTQYTGYVQIRR
jgi:gliding motility-associated-like protein